MKKILIALLAFVGSIGANDIDDNRSMKKYATAYATVAAGLHGAGKKLYTFSQAPKNAIDRLSAVKANLNIFDFSAAKEYKAKDKLRQNAFNAGRVMLKTSSALHAPIRSAIVTGVVYGGIILSFPVGPIVL